MTDINKRYPMREHRSTIRNKKGSEKERQGQSS